MNIQEAIVEFAKREREEAEKAKENERNIASIDPESYIAKEIKYQTTLLHAISEEVYQIKKAIEKNEEQSPSSRKNLSSLNLNGEDIKASCKRWNLGMINNENRR